MKYPGLVRPAQCKVPIRVTIEAEEIDEDGAPVAAFETDLTCNYQSSAKKVPIRQNDSGQKEYVQISGVALFNGDIAPDLSDISSGSVVIFGETRQIAQGSKARNPDGTVNYTRLELI